MFSQLAKRAAILRNTRFFCSEGREGQEGEEGGDITKENAQLIIDKWVKQNKVVLFMKGTPRIPQCGYSNFVVELLKKYGKGDES